MPIGKMLETVVEELGKKIDDLDLEMSLDALLKNYGAKLDRIILDEEHDKNCSYIGGELKITALAEENYQCAYSLYFEDADESVHTVEANTKPLEMKFLTADFRERLTRDGVLKFDIDEPSEQSRAEYRRAVK